MLFNFHFSTLTNVNFDQDRFPEYIRQAVEYREEFRVPLLAAYVKSGKPVCEALTQGPAVWKSENGYEDLDYLASEGKVFVFGFAVEFMLSGADCYMPTQVCYLHHVVMSPPTKGRLIDLHSFCRSVGP
jgi:hypothetical protein